MNEAEFKEISDFINILADASKKITLNGFLSNKSLYFLLVISKTIVCNDSMLPNLQTSPNHNIISDPKKLKIWIELNSWITKPPINPPKKVPRN